MGRFSYKGHDLSTPSYVKLVFKSKSKKIVMGILGNWTAYVVIRHFAILCSSINGYPHYKICISLKKK